MFNRTYNHSEYTQDSKNKVRYLVDMTVKMENLSYVNYFLPEVLTNVYYFSPIITSYMDEEKSKIKNIDSLIEQMLIIRIMNLFTERKKTEIETIKYTLKPYKGSEDLPNGMTLYNAVIPLETCDAYNYLIGALPIDTETKDVRFSLTGKDEVWGDIPPSTISCLYSTLFTEIFMSNKTRAIYNKQKEVSLACSKKEGNEDLVIVCLAETTLKGEECNLWAKKEKSHINMKVEAGSILILKRESYYNWKYMFEGNKGLIIIK